MPHLEPWSPPGLEAGEHERALVVFAKEPVAGRVKTRLAPALGPERAAELHAAFVADVIEELARGRYSTRVAWARVEAGGEARRRVALPPGVLETTQRGEGLGERLYHGLREAARAAESVAAVGSDHPELRHERVEEAFERLESGLAETPRVVVGPAEDGGYYLLAADRRALRRELFAGIDWSTPAVLEQTLERCRRLGLQVSLLGAGSDVDTPRDLERLVALFAADPAEPYCPRSRRLLRSWGYRVAEAPR